MFPVISSIASFDPLGHDFVGIDLEHSCFIFKERTTNTLVGITAPRWLTEQWEKTRCKCGTAEGKQCGGNCNV